MSSASPSDSEPTSAAGSSVGDDPEDHDDEDSAEQYEPEDLVAVYVHDFVEVRMANAASVVHHLRSPRLASHYFAALLADFGQRC